MEHKIYFTKDNLLITGGISTIVLTSRFIYINILFCQQTWFENLPRKKTKERTEYENKNTCR